MNVKLKQHSPSAGIQEKKQIIVAIATFLPLLYVYENFVVQKQKYSTASCSY